MPIGNVITTGPQTDQISHPRSDADREREYSETVKNVLSMAAMAAGCIISLSALIIWPIAYIKGWSSDPLVTIMLVLSLALVTLGVHYRDVLEANSRR